MKVATVVRPRAPAWRPLLAAALWLAVLGFFLALAVLATAHDLFLGDLGLAHRLQDVNAGPYRTALAWAEALSDLPGLVAVYLGSALALWLAARRWEMALLVATALGRLLNFLAKEMVARPRPSPELLEVTERASGYGFPSGHVEGAILLYGFLFYLAAVAIPQRPLRWLIQGACLAIIGLVAVQRVYVGAHWPSDILGGLLLGGLLLAPVIWVHRRYLAGGA